MTRAELIKVLESLEGPSKELDAAIVRTLGHATAQAPNADHFVYRKHDDPGYTWDRVPPYTSSIDSALTLVPEGWLWNRMRNVKSRQDRVRRFHITLSKPVPGSTSPKEGTRQGAKHKLPAIALTIAALKAQESTQ